MTPVKQTRLYIPESKQRGNCLPACIASLLDLDMGAVPQFQEFYDNGQYCWYQMLKTFLGERGFYCHGWYDPPEDTPAVADWWPCLLAQSPGVDGYFIANGHTGRSATVTHSAIYHGGALAHDPHPDGSGLTTVDSLFVIDHVAAPSLQ